MHQQSAGQLTVDVRTVNGTGTGDWAQAYDQAKTLVAQMTLEEKNIFVYGASDAQGCSGFIPSIPRLEFPGICFNDGPTGVRGATMVSA